MNRLSQWLFDPVPLARVVLFRRFVYAFVIIDILLLHTSGFRHGWADPVWYQPLIMGEWLNIPAANVPQVMILKWGTVLVAAFALTGRFPRVSGLVVAVGWIWYQYVAFAYGKVDHDRGDFVIALVVLPLIGMAATAGPAGDRTRSELAGFAFRAMQLAAIATYFLSAWAKVRFGGWEWVNSATITRAVIRRGTFIGDWLLEIPWSLHAFQWVLFSAEMLAPVIFFVGEKWRRRMVAAWFVFHAATYSVITIAFWPHLVMMLAFLPLEEYRDRAVARWNSWRGGDSGEPEPQVKTPASPA
ncbi:hypothetical protein [Kineosporia babensis]|uniref:HTTM domain-containing protein n=1 Tax=Kineosporia babensis TaxID=499548 RepID=A0A9X1SXV9_9ACTN|nr:hypothetical protein [Kineosporia babensis]MCD5316391.1 hypothetical protein [Kineosporia babensis]